MYISTTLHVINHKNNFMNLQNNNKTYLIAFPKKFHATIVKNQINIDSKIYFTNRTYINVKDDVNYGLIPYDVPKIKNDILIDDNAFLHISKSLEYNTNFIIDKYDLSDILLYPFTKNIGIVLPMDIQKDDNHEFIFDALVVEPIFDTELFSKNLKI